MSYLSDLNASQYEAVTAPLGPVRVLAGAGSGKTRVLIARIAWLLMNNQVAPHGILAVTFTNKAALEMKVRLESLVEGSLRGLWLGTFHSLCHRFLRLHAADAKLPSNFQIMDSDDQIRLCRRIIRSASFDEKAYPPRELANFINGHKDEGRRPQHIEVYDQHSKNMLYLYERYQALCEQSALVDFSEIILRSLETLRTNEDLLAHYQERFQFILVDEFQDTNSVQYAWLQLLSGKHQRIFVVGDDDQSIYGWRGAKIEHILNFDRDFPAATTIRLEQNYRSTKAILEAANHIIEKNQGRLDKRLWTDNESAELITTYRAMDGYDEARFVVERIREEIREGRRAPSEIAILYRSNAQSRVFEEFLIRNKVPYRVYGGLRFFDRAEIKDILAYLRVLVNPNDDVSLERSMTVPPKGIGPATIEQVRTFAAEHQLSLWAAIELMLESQSLNRRAHNVLLRYVEMINTFKEVLAKTPLDEFFTYVIEESGLKPHYAKEPMNRGEDRIENLAELVTAADYFINEYNAELAFLDEEHERIEELSSAQQLEAFLLQTTLDSTDGQADEGEESVQLMTLHASKGLEFPEVYLVGMEEGLFPSEASATDPDRLEEERRLAYVGITRAEEKLYLTSAESRMIYGKTRYARPSRFLLDIPEHLLEHRGPAIKIRPTHIQQCREGIASRRSGSGISGFGDYKIGQLVKHPKFGEGVILGFEGSGVSARVAVEFATAGKKVLVLGYAKLTIL